MDVEKIKKARSLLTELQGIFASGPLDYYFEKLLTHSEALLTLYAPAKVGDTIALAEDVPCTGGWKQSRHFLVKGRDGVVQHVDYDSHHGFIFEWVPHNQTWIDGDGTYYPVRTPHSYCLSQRYFGFKRPGEGGQQ